MAHDIGFEVDLAGLGIGDERRALIRDRFTAALVGSLPGGLGHVVAAEWKGDRLCFEYRPTERVLIDLLDVGCSECGGGLELAGNIGPRYDAPVCRNCMRAAEEDAKEDGHNAGMIAGFEEVETLIDEAMEGAKDAAGLALNRLKTAITDRKKQIEH